MKITGFRSAFCALATTVSVQANAATIVLGGYPDQLQFVDDTNGHVTQKVTMETGLPSNIQLSADGKKIYVMTLTAAGLEVVDAYSHKVLTKFSLNTPIDKYRFLGGVPDASGHYFYAIGWHMNKLLDRYRIGKPQYLVIDIQEKKVVRSADIDDDDKVSNGRPSFAVSPNGKTFYVFSKKVLIVDTHDLKVTRRIDLAMPDSSLNRDVNMGGIIHAQRDPNHYISLFQSQDPYIHNKTFGVARFDLTSGTFNYTPIGAAPHTVEGLEISPDGKDGYAIEQNGEYGSQRCEMWHFDIKNNIAVDHAEFPCRRRFYFSMSYDGKKLYIYGAGYDIAVYNAKTLKQETDWELRNDITMAGIINLPQ